MRQVAGVACMKLMSCLSMSVCSASGSAASFRRASTTQAPVINGRYNSSPAISKAMVVTASSVSAALIAVISRIEQRKFSISRCSTITPLGLPVEPEVKSTYAR
ncbi:hypothetical protein AWB76_07835 [Caballeronia temeraria]|uniref:Secreted protein n=1 Tax=Caballeronia temeraria TaxID=1777137 RepID=A0A158DZY2_9BURK|nr:hypothetical protein AWB76_07835 [Caballeronia temeraria]